METFIGCPSARLSMRACACEEREHTTVMYQRCAEPAASGAGHICKCACVCVVCVCVCMCVCVCVCVCLCVCVCVHTELSGSTSKLDA